MKPRNGGGKDGFRASLDTITQARRGEQERKRALIAQAAARMPAPIETTLANPESEQTSTHTLPSLRLYHRSDLDQSVNYVGAAAEAVSIIAKALADRENRVVFSWPDRINRPLGVTISALLGAQAARPDLRATVAYFPFTDRKTHTLKSIFVDEKDLAERYMQMLRSMAVYEGPDYQNAYLLKSLVEATGSRRPSAISHPNLRELIPTFAPIGDAPFTHYAERDEDFLGDIASRRTLIREAPRHRRDVSSKERAPIAVMGLPATVEGINRLFKAEVRLRERTDLVIADATDVPFGGAEAWLKGFRRVVHLARGISGRPPIVVITQDGFIAKTAAEIISASVGGTARNASTRIHGAVKIVPNDFTVQPEGADTWNAVTFSTRLKSQELAGFREEALALAKKLRDAGYQGPADAVVKAVTFVRTVACLPIPPKSFRAHLDRMQDAGAVSDYVAAKYRYLGVSASLQQAERDSDSLGDAISAFRQKAEAHVIRYDGGGEVSEFVRDLIGKASNKANRTIVAFRDRVVLSAAAEWFAVQTDLDQEKLEGKVILTTAEALASTLASTSRGGAPIDTLILVNPMIRQFERIILSPSLPRKVTLIGDGGTLGAIGNVLNPVIPLFTGAPAERLTAMSRSLSACADEMTRFDFERAISPEFEPDLVLDFTVQDDPASGRYEGPVVELITEDGYLLRLLPQAECLAILEDETGLRAKIAERVEPGDRIFVFSRDLHDRLEFLLGPVRSEGANLLSSYQNAVRDRVTIIPGDRREQVLEILRRMKSAADAIGEAADFGKNELSNVMRWMSTGRTGGRPDAPRSVKAFALFMNALGVPEMISAQYWHNAVISSRVMAIQVGLHAHGRALEFVRNPHAFYARAAEKGPELKQLWEEMVRSASVVVRKDIVPAKRGREKKSR